MVNWLITGGCGFLGTALVSRLTESHNNNIRIIDNLSVGTELDLELVSGFQKIDVCDIPKVPSGVELLVGNILDDQLAIDISKNIDVIVHFAANTGVGPSVQNPREDLLANVIGTFNYLEAARINSVQKFIFASSGAPAGNIDPPIHEEVAPHPVSPYGASKLAGEGYCSAYSKTYGVETIALRFGNVYGPGSVHKASVVAKFIQTAIEGGQLEIYGDGTQTRDFIYIDDLIDAVLLVSQSKNIGGEIFQIASSRETTIIDLIKVLEKCLKKYGFKDIRKSNTERKIGEVKRNFSDTSKALKVLNWESRHTIDNGVEKTVKYFIEKSKKNV